MQRRNEVVERKVEKRYIKDVLMVMKIWDKSFRKTYGKVRLLDTKLHQLPLKEQDGHTCN